LTLHALQAPQLKEARNMLSQKAMGYTGEITTEMDLTAFAEGQRAGLFCLGNLFNGIGVLRENGRNQVYFENNGNIEKVQLINSQKIYLRIKLDDLHNEHLRYYSYNGTDFIPCFPHYALKTGNWKGIRVGLFSYNILANDGIVRFNNYTYTFQ
jgi:Beta xylosidase C-terminal Concanavalin A-like domain